MHKFYVNQLKREDFRTSKPATVVRWNLDNNKILSATCQWIVPNIYPEDFNFLSEPRKTLFSPTFSAGDNDELKWDITALILDEDCTIKVFFGQSKIKTYDFQIGYRTYSADSRYFCCFGEIHSSCKQKGEYFSFTDQLEYMDINLKVIIIMDIVADLSTQAPITSCIPITNIDTFANKTGQINSVLQEKPEDKLIQDLENLWDKGYWADVIIIVSGKKLKAHRSILSARSLVFYDLFNNSSSNREIEIADFSYETVHEMLHFIYTGKLCDLGIETMQELLIIGKKYDLDSLIVLCKDTLCKKYVDGRNVISLLNFSHDHSIKQLEDLCIDFIAKNMAAVDPEKLKSLKPELSMSILLKSIELKK